MSVAGTNVSELSDSSVAYERLYHKVSTLEERLAQMIRTSQDLDTENDALKRMLEKVRLPARPGARFPSGHLNRFLIIPPVARAPAARRLVRAGVVRDATRLNQRLEPRPSSSVRLARSPRPSSPPSLIHPSMQVKSEAVRLKRKNEETRKQCFEEAESRVRSSSSSSSPSSSSSSPCLSPHRAPLLPLLLLYPIMFPAQIAVERQMEDFKREWLARLEAKEQEVADLRAQYAEPKDLEVLKLKVREELEAPFQDKVQSLEADCDKYRELLFALRREHELLKTEFEQYTRDQGQAVEDMRAEHAAIVAELSRENTALNAEVDRLIARSDGRAAREEALTATTRLRALEEEADALRRAKEEAVVAREELRLALGRTETELAMQRREHERVLAAAERGREAAESEAARARAEAQEAKARVRAIEEECDRLGAQTVAAEARIRDAVAGAETRLVDARTAWSRERDELQARVSHLARSLAASEERSLDLEHAVAAAQRDADARLGQLRRALEERVQEVESQKLLADRAWEDRAARGGEAERERAAELERLREELLVARDEAAQAERERKSAVARTQALQHQMEQERDARASEARNAREVETEYRALQSAHRQLLATGHAYKTEKDALERQLAESRAEVAALERTADEFRASIEQLTKANDEAEARRRSELARERDEFAAREEALHSAHAEALGKERAKVKTYHDRCHRATSAFRKLRDVRGRTKEEEREGGKKWRGAEERKERGRRGAGSC